MEKARARLYIHDLESAGMLTTTARLTRGSESLSNNNSLNTGSS